MAARQQTSSATAPTWIMRSERGMLTVLSGRDASAPFTLPDGRLVCVGPSARDHPACPALVSPPRHHEHLGSRRLFRLSYAVQRRFAIIHVGAPDDAAYARLLDRHAQGGDAGPLDGAALASLGRIFHSSGARAPPHQPCRRPRHGALPAPPRRRGRGPRGGDRQYLLPQLEGLAPDAAAAIWALFDGETAGAPDHARRELGARFRELFPRVRLPIV